MTSTALTLLIAGGMLLPLYGSLAVGGRAAGSLAITGLFVITLVRPEDGLLLCAGFLPLGALIGRFLGFPCSMRDPLVLAFLAAWCLREAMVRHPAADSTSRALLLPAFLFAAVVAASIAVQLMIQQVYEDFPFAFAVRVVAQLVAGKYITGDMYPGMVAGGRLLEGVGLFAATVVLCRRRPTLARRALAMAAVAAAGIAALNLYRIAVDWLNDPGVLWTVAFSPRSLRVDLLLGGPNSGGSYFAMMLFVALGLVISRRCAGWTWALPATTILAALWLTGSRAAWAGALVAGVVLLLWQTSLPSRMRALAVFGVVAALLATATLGMAVVRTHPWTDQSVAIATRTELGLAALRMTQSHPVFGLGVGRFFEESVRYIDPGFAAAYSMHHENAHNNFLQILAEFGLVGFVTFIWLLGVAGRRIGERWRAGDDTVIAGAGVGIVAFLWSCLAGHPLLIPEVSLAFWLVLGAAVTPGARKKSDSNAGLRRTAPVSRSAGRTWMLWVAIASLAVSVPVRARSFLANEADLRGAAIGFLGRLGGDDTLAERAMQGRAQFFVRGTTCAVRLSVRLDPRRSERAADLEVRVDGQVANRFPAVADSWRELKIMLPVDSNTRFRRIELRTVGPNVRVLMTEPALAECKDNRF